MSYHPRPESAVRVYERVAGVPWERFVWACHRAHVYAQRKISQQMETYNGQRAKEAQDLQEQYNQRILACLKGKERMSSTEITKATGVRKNRVEKTVKLLVAEGRVLKIVAPNTRVYYKESANACDAGFGNDGDTP